MPASGRDRHPQIGRLSAGDGEYSLLAVSGPSTRVNPVSTLALALPQLTSAREIIVAFHS
jgi:hypothetical protein